MKEESSPLNLNATQYERPNQKWICGKAKDGKACHLGPDGKGHCRVTFECTPGQKIKAGETKGRYFCTRTTVSGDADPCPQGPLPDGSCCRLITKCVPVRTLRSQRGLLTFFACVVTASVLLITLWGPNSESFVSPGPLSDPHASIDFARKAGGNDNCAACHDTARGRLFTWIKDGLAVKPGPFAVRAMMSKEEFGMTGIDQHCVNCHKGHSFHQPNVLAERSCSACHLEHQGSGPMGMPTDANCVACHGNAAIMEASARKGENMPAATFDFRPTLGRVAFHAPRPQGGYTKVIHGFAKDHPEFQFLRDGMKDPDTLKFNHELHLTPAKVSWQGKGLECADCHKQDSSGVYHLKITYAANCFKCHAIQFDPRNPGLMVPHGNVDHVRDFLRTLPQEYTAFAARTLGPGNTRRNEAFAREQYRKLMADYASGEELEQAVFGNGRLSGPGGATIFPGCAYCHEVTKSVKGDPQITAPAMPDHWLVHTRFDHSKHLRNIPGLDPNGCAFCHDAAHSRDTSDIILPSKQTCAKCHSPAGGVSFACSTCHDYHTPRKDSMTSHTADVRGSDSWETLRKAVASRDK